MLLFKLMMVVIGIHPADTGRLPALHTLTADQIVSVTSDRGEQTVTVTCKDGSQYIYGKYDWDMEDTFRTTEPVIRNAISKAELVFTKAETAPQFPGGDKAWDDYIRKYCQEHHDEIARYGAVTVTLKFVVHFKGQVTHVRLASRDANFSSSPPPPGTVEPPVSRMEELAMSAIEEGPAWIPATQNGRIVMCYMRQVVKLQ